jgi:hypothetical protein
MLGVDVCFGRKNGKLVIGIDANTTRIFVGFDGLIREEDVVVGAEERIH